MKTSRLLTSLAMMALPVTLIAANAPPYFRRELGEMGEPDIFVA